MLNSVGRQGPEVRILSPRPTLRVVELANPSVAAGDSFWKKTAGLRTAALRAEVCIVESENQVIAVTVPCMDSNSPDVKTINLKSMRF